MDNIESIISRNTDFTFEEAVEFFGGKVPITAKEFEKLADKYKNLAFTVSGYTSIEALQQFQDELLSAVEEGTTVEAFRKNMNTFLEEQGYTKKEKVSAYQAENIFQNNIQTAYQAGHYNQMTDPVVMQLRPFWQYNAVTDEATRPEHLAMNGRVFPADDSVWDTWFPPNGYRCRCTVTSLSRRQVEQRGLIVETEAPKGAMLPDGRFTATMPDPRFSTNPAKSTWEPDLSGYPEALVKAYESRQQSS